MWNQTDPVKHSALVPRATEKDRDTETVGRDEAGRRGQREALTPGSPGTSHSQRHKFRGAEAVASEL